MPPEPNSLPPGPPAGKPRRRLDQGAGSGWVGVVVVLLLLGLIAIYSVNRPTPTLAWSDFWTILSNDKYNTNLKKVIYSGKDRIYFEVRDAEDLPKDVQEKYKKATTFNVQRLQT